MSFIIALYVGEGLVFASDSRSTYQSSLTNPDGSVTIDHGVHITDTTNKTFLTSSNVAISTCGDASLNDRPITGYIESFIGLYGNANVDVVRDEILQYFRGLSNTLDTIFIVGGYLADNDGRYNQKLYRVKTIDGSIEAIDTTRQGAIWSGESDVMSRVITDLYIRNNDGSYSQHVRYPILWQHLSLQDAVDFAKYAVQITIDTMKFQKRVKTVGGPIDILVVKPDSAQWISRKVLHG
ncbi:MAG: hypothetical protein J5502_06925 [Prevotella sp.]|nr:hypothetical protein [Prevotella sp.]